jgi:hypothetical protein
LRRSGNLKTYSARIKRKVPNCNTRSARKLFYREQKSSGSGKENQQWYSETKPGSGKVYPQGIAKKEQTVITVTWHKAVTTVIVT